MQTSNITSYRGIFVDIDITGNMQGTNFLIIFQLIQILYEINNNNYICNFESQTMIVSIRLS